MAAPRTTATGEHIQGLARAAAVDPSGLYSYGLLYSEKLPGGGGRRRAPASAMRAARALHGALHKSPHCCSPHHKLTCPLAAGCARTRPPDPEGWAFHLGANPALPKVWGERALRSLPMLLLLP